MSAIRFKSLSSGSCGNCYFIGIEEDGVITDAILVDAGVSQRRLKKELGAEHIDLSVIKAVIVTHDHMDHIRSLGSYCKYLQLPVYATKTLHDAMARHTYTLEHLCAVRRDLRDGEWNEIVPGKFSVRYFVVPHDATQTVGYGIRIGEGYPFVIMTDLGAMTSEAMSYASHARTVVIESNYDMDMLMGGPYTHELKMRICQGNGHLSNDGCAEAITKFYHSDLDHLFLCHLSENNNTPQLAYAASSEALGKLGFKASYDHSASFVRDDGDSVTLQPLPRRTPSPLFTL